MGTIFPSTMVKNLWQRIKFVFNDMDYICCVTGFRFAAVLAFETPLSIGIRDEFAAVGRCSLYLRIYNVFVCLPIVFSFTLNKKWNKPNVGKQVVSKFQEFHTVDICSRDQINRINRDNSKPRHRHQLWISSKTIQMMVIECADEDRMLHLRRHLSH